SVKSPRFFRGARHCGACRKARNSSRLPPCPQARAATAPLLFAFAQPGRNGDTVDEAVLAADEQVVIDDDRPARRQGNGLVILCITAHPALAIRLTIIMTRHASGLGVEHMQMTIGEAKEFVAILDHRSGLDCLVDAVLPQRSAGL